jgi:hypothetical protein
MKIKFPSFTCFICSIKSRSKGNIQRRQAVEKYKFIETSQRAYEYSVRLYCSNKRVSIQNRQMIDIKLWRD